MMNNDRGRGASGPKKPAPETPRYGISSNMAPPSSTPADHKRLDCAGYAVSDYPARVPAPKPMR
jgi:hypothetical protein